MKLTEDNLVKDKLANNKAKDDSKAPHEDLKQGPAIARVAGEYETEAVADNGDETFCLTVGYWVLCVD